MGENIFPATARCDGDQLAVGACGSGFNNDCPGGTFTLVECCRVAEFYYGTCEAEWSTAVVRGQLSDYEVADASSLMQ